MSETHHCHCGRKAYRQHNGDWACPRCIRLDSRKPSAAPAEDPTGEFSERWWRETARQVESGYRTFCRNHPGTEGLTLRELIHADCQRAMKL